MNGAAGTRGKTPVFKPNTAKKGINTRPYLSGVIIENFRSNLCPSGTTEDHRSHTNAGKRRT